MSTLAVLKNAGRHFFAAQIAHEAIGVQAYLLGVVNEERGDVPGLAPNLLLLVKLVVHFPKVRLALQARGFRGLCRDQRMLVWGDEWALAKNNSQAVAEFSLNLFKFRVVVAA